MKQEVHTCDRCGDTFNVPERNLYLYDVRESSITDKVLELCGLCYEANEAWFDCKPIAKAMKGVIDHERRLYDEKRTGEDVRP